MSCPGPQCMSIHRMQALEFRIQTGVIATENYTKDDFAEMNRFVLAPDPDVRCVHGLGFSFTGVASLSHGKRPFCSGVQRLRNGMQIWMRESSESLE